ncbi:spore germination protein [Anaerobacillus arseniciselenatis]|uniref:Spore germination protein n=1 Tax=Anaerobacillus arseniciselenatis TaxID=85682 RepID=A0A1S2LPE7_9BACI|nr:spore germination protein [Anaerobacillus arseniciselenatis]OIJ14246.1 spore germination protein [Anaerobacillus arseniciselenatis]
MTNTIYHNLDKNLSKIKSDLGNSSDLSIRKIHVNVQKSLLVAILYMEGLSDKDLIETSIIKSLLEKNKDALSIGAILDNVKEKNLTIPKISEVSDYSELYTALLSGETLLLVDGYNKALMANTPKWEARSVDEPSTEAVIRGPKEGFVENIIVNSALLRRRIKDKNLWLETKEIGSVTKTSVSFMYLKDTANDGVVNEVRNKLSQINTDAILESGFIEEYIEDTHYSPFPTVFNSERPDVIAAGILEGRVAILIDGTPFVLLVPALFTHFFQSPEDYYNRSDFGLIRFLRLFCLFIALLGPSFFIALTTFHQETIPTILLVSLAAQREGVPFPALLEAFLMEITFEILREAGIRMPRMVGQALSIVGALVIGQAAVEAGFVSAAMVIVVAITAISSFVIPSYDLAIAIRLLRFVIMILAATFGFFGIIVGLLAILLHLAHLRSFQTPYMTNFGPFIFRNQKDNVFRFPIPSINKNKKTFKPSK